MHFVFQLQKRREWRQIEGLKGTSHDPFKELVALISCLFFVSASMVEWTLGATYSATIPSSSFLTETQTGLVIGSEKAGPTPNLSGENPD